MLGLEDSGSRMNRIGRSELELRRASQHRATLERIDGVTVDEVNAVARRLLSRPFGAAVLGPYRSKRQLPQPLQTL